MTAGLINVERKGGRRADEGRAMFEEEEREKKKQRSAARLSAGVRRLIR